MIKLYIDENHQHMESNEILREQIFEIIKNQIESNTPPETKQTLKRLVDSGYSVQDARMLIGQCLAVELFSVLKLKKPFNNDRYVSNMKKLPEEPFED
jgi:hypothetical protein